jgi:hypothetical protein
MRIDGKMQIWNSAQAQPGRQLMTEKMLRVFEPGQRLFLPGRVAYRHPYMRMPHIGRHLGRRNSDGAYPRIVHFEANQLRNFLPDGLGNALRSVFIHGRRRLQPLGIRADQHGPQQPCSLVLHRLQHLQREVSAR